MIHADILRYICIFLQFTILVMTAKITILYYKAYRFEKGRRRGLLPHYVYLMSLSYLLLTASAVTLQVRNLGTKPSISLYGAALALVLGFIAMVQIFRYERLKLRSTPPPVHIDDEL